MASLEQLGILKKKEKVIALIEKMKNKLQVLRGMRRYR
jgi:hypothetical protein